MREWEEELRHHIEEWMEYQLKEKDTRPARLTPQEIFSLQRLKQSLNKRKARLLNIKATIHPYRIQTFKAKRSIKYQLSVSRLIKIKENYHLEEELQHRECTVYGSRIVIDHHVDVEKAKGQAPIRKVEQREKPSYGFQYDRRKAVQYAEQWWNDYNPQYQRFTDNCTNFISQCLYAGDAPMTGMPDRAKGWWYSGENWSFSWSVAHSLRWYLSGATTGLTAREVENATDLGLGDVICYDFNGDGRWQHSTIVTNFDGNHEPLVNAQTSNSRARYWTYEDSTAWTPNIQYKFFRIG